MNIESLMTDVCGPLVLLAPTVLFAILGGLTLTGRPLPEKLINRMCISAGSLGFVASLLMLGLMLAGHSRHVAIEFGEWIHLPNFHLNVKFVFDRLSVPLAILSFLLCSTIGSFATRYLHREPGYQRFFVLLSLFMAGMVIASVAGTVETLFTGWEFVGLSSALLVAFFQERPAPARNAFRVWVVYRISDAALLLAAVALHHLTGEGDFDRALGGGPWPEGVTPLSAYNSLIVGSLLLFAAAGKSALVPFSGWLPRAMEGPTPSSAVFYGALSVHLGAFLLLRVSPLLDQSLILCVLVTALGLATSVYAYLAGAVQTDIKSALSFASLSQVGLIVAEIGVGFRYLALIHLLGHACLRTLQFLRAPSLLADFNSLENAIGQRLPSVDRGRWLSTRAYRFALARGFLDALLLRLVVTPFVQTFRWCDRQERRWAAWLAGPGAESRSKPEEWS
ncbi:MAG: hypothetical protein K1X57_19805 [Gemmataceae bacterium]|nr:hypothetical protein [Gemmataceae bacterium]